MITFQGMDSDCRHAGANPNTLVPRYIRRKKFNPLIFGLAFGLAGGLVTLAYAIWFFRRRRRRKAASKGVPPMSVDTSSGQGNVWTEAGGLTGKPR